MKPAYTIITHADSNRSYHTPAAIAARKKGLNHFTYQFIREFPREVDLKRAARARKRQEKSKLATP
jgi:predicted RNA-binding protein with PUA-like domain